MCMPIGWHSPTAGCAGCSAPCPVWPEPFATPSSASSSPAFFFFSSSSSSVSSSSSSPSSDASSSSSFSSRFSVASLPSSAATVASRSPPPVCSCRRCSCCSCFSSCAPPRSDFARPGPIEPCAWRSRPKRPVIVAFLLGRDCHRFGASDFGRETGFPKHFSQIGPPRCDMAELIEASARAAGERWEACANAANEETTPTWD